MLPNWIVVEWTLAALASVFFWLIVVSMLAEHFRAHGRATRHRHDRNRPTPLP
jgi:hypothetical protein